MHPIDQLAPVAMFAVVGTALCLLAWDGAVALIVRHRRARAVRRRVAILHQQALERIVARDIDRIRTGGPHDR